MSAGGSPSATRGSARTTPAAGRDELILVCNAGSSSLRVGLVESQSETERASAHVDWTGGPARIAVRRASRPPVEEERPLHGHAEAFARVLELLSVSAGSGAGTPVAIGHRVVHGGDRYTRAVPITPEVLEHIRAWTPRAPLHHPASLAAIEAAERLLPGVPQYAAFDTAFHATLPEAARVYPLPSEWTRQWGLRRYGFHGLSHAWAAGRAAAMLGRPRLRLVIAHLGAGASVSAVRDGTCVDTSMGFTPLEGLMMGSRSGSVDPGLLLHLLRDRGVDAAGLDRALNEESGLLGVSGVSSDMRAVLAAQAGNPAARLAVEIYLHRLRREIGAMAATLGGLDALVFTAGVGENSAEIRRRACEGLEHLGLRLDSAANAEGRPDVDIASPDAPARILIVASREDLTIVRELRSLMKAPGGDR